jgi:GAF domain-containing protein
MSGFMVDPVVLRQIGDELKSIANQIVEDVGKVQSGLSFPAGAGDGLVASVVLGNTASQWAEDLLSLAKIIGQAGEDLQANADAYEASDQVEKFDSINMASRP